MAFPFPAGVSGLIDPDDESFIALFELCAAARLDLDMPSYTRDDIERLFELKDVDAPPEPLPRNVVRFTRRASRRT
ncbi:MAG TPA: hypothetical protein VHT05_00620 [Candidatus Elarobacter sp.]|nr:hypothetical protein [Candidatus Elarobacter sp.]